MRVMVVDDDRAVRDVIAYGAGKVSVVNHVVGIADAETALKSFYNGAFDVLVVDYKLPGINGIEFIKRIRKIDDRVGILLVTAVLDHETATQLCEGLGVYAVVTKPFSLKDLQQKIQDAAELSRISPEKMTAIENALEAESVNIRNVGKEIQAMCESRQKKGSTRRLAL